MGETVALEADHRRHAEVENAIRDLKYGVGLNHMPSGRFGANAAWLGLNVMAHNLGRWTSRIGLGESLIATDTLRRRYLRTPGRLSRSARRTTLHLPRNWPWAEQFETVAGQAAGRGAGHLSNRRGRRPPSADPADHPQRENHRKVLIHHARSAARGGVRPPVRVSRPIRDRLSSRYGDRPKTIGGFGLSASSTSLRPSHWSV